MDDDRLLFVRHGIGVAVGLVAMGYAAEAYHWHLYVREDPTLGGSITHFSWAFVLVFIAGTVLAFTAFMTALQKAVLVNN